MTNKTHHFLAYNDPKFIGPIAYVMFGLVYRHKIKKDFFLNFRALVMNNNG